MARLKTAATNAERRTLNAVGQAEGIFAPGRENGLRQTAWRVLRALALGCGVSFAACAPQPQEPPAQATPPVTSTPAPPAPIDDATNGAAPRASQPQGTPQASDRWDVDLQRDERRGGHTLAKHVGRTDAQLQARLRRESISAASTYPDAETAARVVTRALDADATRVQVWVGGRAPKPNLAIRYRAREGIPIGRVLDRGDIASHDARGAVVVLRWRDEGWFVLTSYPEDVR
ncbi:hypothetical protein LuPra_05677 [Luteitalea pratensis]|uniref:Bacterial CdiA-CT RNAse A domain-containing protein n=1 Tax=Luteitalea pratensis TaxID=1855912 RepID=A0A143PX46_LUTPR|nr:RNase A-like domain-containing protein [Luteitalea pratensis]AMY12404.1 hypothetical protein LuPra_05677 [Luteitalea pratensis]